MSPERLLLGGAVAVLALSVVAAAAVPGALEAPDPGREGPGRLDIVDMPIDTGTVGGQTAELVVEVRLSHHGPAAENVTVELRAVGLQSGLLEDTTEVAVPTIEDDREVSVNGTLSVRRSGGYRVEAILYHDGRRYGSASKRVEGVEALRPAYAESPVQFHDFSAVDQPVIEYTIAGTAGERARLSVTTYLTNRGDDAAGGLRLVLLARQADSGIVADSAEVTVGQIRPGRTARPTSRLVVPDGYNYYLDAQLWTDGVIVGTARSAANLDPSETLTVNETRREVELEVSDFEDGRDAGDERRPPEMTVPASGQPGFTAAVALVAVLAAVLLARRRRG